MKVNNIYDKNNLDKLMYKGQSVTKIMDDFFRKCPSEYGINYYKNINNFEIWDVDNDMDALDGGACFYDQNVILLVNNDAIIHELIHMASYDNDREILALQRRKDSNFMEFGMIEGMTEYAAMGARNNECEDYFFPVFAVCMLDDVKNLYGPFFSANYGEFIKLFPHKVDIVSLMYSLDCYEKCNSVFLEKNATKSKVDTKMEKKMIVESIRDVFDKLIDIQLSFRKNAIDNKLYGDKFMDLLNDDGIKDYVFEYDKKGYDYAYSQIKKRILGRR